MAPVFEPIMANCDICGQDYPAMGPKHVCEQPVATECACIPCELCEGNGKFTRKPLSVYPTDEPDTVEQCPACSGHGIERLCETCREMTLTAMRFEYDGTPQSIGDAAWQACPQCGKSMEEESVEWAVKAFRCVECALRCDTKSGEVWRIC